VADHGRAWLDAVLPNPAVLGVLSWGISDRHSWLNDKYPRADGLAQRPLPLDEDLNRKKLWSGIAASLDAAPARGTPSRT
jgi:endo-1,4-beta-xylanase